MELAQCLAKLSTTFHSPFFELPGRAAQLKLSPVGRDILERNFNKDYRQSAVMILLFPDENGKANTLFIERARSRGAHSGQIALPGGAYEVEDKNLIQTAIRETGEEIGVEIPTANVLGKLTDLNVPVSAYKIMPVVAYTDKVPEFVLDKTEVEEVITISIEELKNLQIEQGKFTTPSEFEVSAPYYPLGKHRLWGATSMIIAEFLELL